MDNLPKTLQAMKDYIRYAKGAIKANELNTKRLNEAITYLNERIIVIENG